VEVHVGIARRRGSPQRLLDPEADVPDVGRAQPCLLQEFAGDCLDLPPGNRILDLLLFVTPRRPNNARQIVVDFVGTLPVERREFRAWADPGSERKGLHFPQCFQRLEARRGV
jgi:hypothetical protein